MEDEDDEDEDDEDPSTWYEDEEDGVKGQPIVEPDMDISDIIRIDSTRIPRNEVYCE